jgi:seryl-tRNA synthetase
MISLQHLLQNPQIYKDELKKRFKDELLVDQIVEIYGSFKPKLQELENLRQKKNDFNDKIVKMTSDEKHRAIPEMKATSEMIKVLEAEVRELKENLDKMLYLVPNLTWEKMPVGPDSDSNMETAIYGKKPEFDFEAKNYYDLPVFVRDYKMSKGVEAGGARAYYIAGELARFQKILFDWVFEELAESGFEYVIVPYMVSENLLYGTGFFPTGREDVYEVMGQNKFLVGTSEAQLMFLHSNETLDLTKPKKLMGWTRCFRKESGSYGKDTKGGFRVHEFEKIETVILCEPSQTYAVFEEMTQTFRDKLDKLGLFYHDLETATGDNGYKNHRMIDIEVWFPAQNSFREVCSSSICTDYQTRTLNIKFKNEKGEPELAHSLNCTGITSRTMLAILEQFQDKDGRVKVPQVLQERFGKEWLE